MGRTAAGCALKDECTHLRPLHPGTRPQPHICSFHLIALAAVAFGVAFYASLLLRSPVGPAAPPAAPAFHFARVSRTTQPDGMGSAQNIATRTPTVGSAHPIAMEHEFGPRATGNRRTQARSGAHAAASPVADGPRVGLQAFGAVLPSPTRLVEGVLLAVGALVPALWLVLRRRIPPLQRPVLPAEAQWRMAALVEDSAASSPRRFAFKVSRRGCAALWLSCGFEMPRTLATRCCAGGGGGQELEAQPTRICTLGAQAKLHSTGVALWSHARGRHHVAHTGEVSALEK